MRSRGSRSSRQQQQQQQQQPQQPQPQLQASAKQTRHSNKARDAATSTIHTSPLRVAAPSFQLQRPMPLLHGGGGDLLSATRSLGPELPYPAGAVVPGSVPSLTPVAKDDETSPASPASSTSPAAATSVTSVENVSKPTKGGPAAGADPNTVTRG